MADKDRILVDVNCLAIFLVEDHPGHSYVAHELERGLGGHFIPLVLDIMLHARLLDHDPPMGL